MFWFSAIPCCFQTRLSKILSTCNFNSYYLLQNFRFCLAPGVDRLVITVGKQPGNPSF